MFLEWSHGDATPITLYPHAGLGITCCLWHTPRPPISWSGSPVLAPADFAGFAHASQKSLQIGAGAGELNAILIMTFGVLQSAVSATGEEIGWRGFLVPALAQRLNFTGVALVSGVIWALWHYPLILFGTYNSAAPKWVALLCFTIMILATGAMAAWLRLKSGSVWPAALRHACHNAVIQWLFDSMTVETGRAAWFAGEFGVALAVISILFAIPIWRNAAGTLALAHRGYRSAL